MLLIMKIQNQIIVVGVVATLLSCTQNRKVDSAFERGPAQQVDGITKDQPTLIYTGYGKDGIGKNTEISEVRWTGRQGGFDTGGREDYLMKMYYASTVGISRKGLAHSICFLGSAQEIQQTFFSNSSETAIRNVEEGVKTRASQDGRVLGLRFSHLENGKKKNLFFRMSNCNSGKSVVSGIAKPGDAAGGGRAVPAKPEAPVVEDIPVTDPRYGFTIFHKVKDLDKKKYPEFVLRADYDKAPKENDAKPWAGLDLRDEKQALKFTLMVQKYFYENMANQSKNNDFNFIASKNKDRYWCHMPWMHTGVAGREAVHGLTQERDLIPSFQITPFKNATSGTNWGVAYFNGTGCRGIGEVFGTAKAPKAKPDFSRPEYFEDGTVITKILFTTANFPDLAGAYTWNAHVNEVGSTERMIKPVRHIQMDIAVKDSSLKGVNVLLKNWAMAGFYFDPTYDYDKDLKEFLDNEPNPLASIPNLPKELLKMRPMGVQTGFDSPEYGKDTITFNKAETNGLKGRLNGPADNPKTSCLGCHGAAGTQARMVPGFLSMKMYEPFKSVPALDFNQQLALAKANYETAIP